ncbi:MAG: hypothetical protein CMM52_05915 [Rhodospirillaceae bacterium]|mgnify:CR=1 FL=1|nr:hypothetical protein [Rhodospirillaceae bacterium]|tara:strand:- start:25129 stop:25893 length:765 start_codon:yes stop_codon:yes gene_type:complete
MEFLTSAADISTATFLLLCVLSCLSGAMGVGAGLGGGVMLLAFMTTIFSPAILIPLHGAVLLGTNIGRAILMFKFIRRDLLPAFGIGAILGAAVGANIVINLPTAILQVVLGCFILYVCWAPAPASSAYSHKKFFGLGFGGTILALFIGSSGVVIAPFVAKVCNDRHEYVGTQYTYMSLIHGLKILVFGFLGFTLAGYLPLILAMIATAFLGSYLGKMLLKVMPEKLFKIIFQVTLTALALRLLYAGLKDAGWI